MTLGDIEEAYRKTKYGVLGKREVTEFAQKMVRNHNQELEKIVNRKYWAGSNITDIILSIREAKP